jgi:hypothetical protein
MTRFVRRVTLAIIWLLIAAVISVGAAGLVAAMAHQPGTAARAELTIEGDEAAAPALAATVAELTDLAKDVKQLGELGRGALAAIVASDTPTLDTTVADGQALARTIVDRSAQIREQLALLPGAGPNEELTWSPEIRAERDRILQATQTTGDLDGLWTRLAFGSLTATRLTKLLLDHDTVAGQAAALGHKEQYKAGLTQLAKADTIIADARALRDALTGIDVTTLTQWLDRNAEYDVALRHLFQAVIKAKGRVTAETKQAFIDERKAHDLLPANTSGIVIILAEIGRGGLNQAVIGIEEARGQLEAAVDSLTASPASGQPGSTDGPSASPNR